MTPDPAVVTALLGTQHAAQYATDPVFHARVEAIAAFLPSLVDGLAVAPPRAVTDALLAAGDVLTSCSWCAALNPTTRQTCPGCGHDAQQPRMACRCHICRRLTRVTPP